MEPFAFSIASSETLHAHDRQRRTEDLFLTTFLEASSTSATSSVGR